MTFYSKNAMVLTTSPLESKRQILTEKVRRMADLPVGFSHGEGIPVTEAAVMGAEQLILLASQLEIEADVFPNLNGGCAVAFYKDLEKIEVSVDSEGDSANLTFERGIGFQFEDVIPPMENVGIAEITDQVLKLRRFDNHLWKLSASSICEISTDALNGSETLSVKTHQNPMQLLLRTEKAGSLSLNRLVLA
jgi:hypothetical protein